jgi:hypothetical protein
MTRPDEWRIEITDEWLISMRSSMWTAERTAEDPWVRKFSRAMALLLGRRGWEPSQKQAAIMERIVADMTAGMRSDDGPPVIEDFEPDPPEPDTPSGIAGIRDLFAKAEPVSSIQTNQKRRKVGAA